MCPKRVDHRGDAAYRDLPFRRHHRERIGQEGDASRVVQVRVTDDGMLDFDLLGNRQGATDGTGIDEDAIVHEKRRWPLSEPFTAERPQYSDLQKFLQLDQFTVCDV